MNCVACGCEGTRLRSWLGYTLTKWILAKVLRLLPVSSCRRVGREQRQLTSRSAIIFACEK
jgi:hypothetical protein